MFKENAISMEHLLAGETIDIYGFGQSMTPILKNGQGCTVCPITDEVQLNKNDIVFCKVKGHFYLHKIIAIKNRNTFLIGNNHGHQNGWISKNKIYGKVIKIL